MLLCPWDSLDRNTGVGSLSLLQGPNPGIKPRSPALQVDYLPSEPPGSPCSNDLVKSTVRIRDDVCKTASARHTTGAQKEAVLFDYAWFLLGSYRCSYAVCETFYKTKGKKKIQ